MVAFTAGCEHVPEYLTPTNGGLLSVLRIFSPQSLLLTSALCGSFLQAASMVPECLTPTNGGLLSPGQLVALTVTFHLLFQLNLC